MDAASGATVTRLMPMFIEQSAIRNTRNKLRCYALRFSDFGKVPVTNTVTIFPQ